MAIVGVPLVNGTEYTHADIVCNIMGRPVIDVLAIDYSDPQDITLNYGTGQHPTSRSFGNVKPQASITLSRKEVDRLTKDAPGNKIQNFPDFDIGVNYVTEAGDFVRDRLLRCRFKGRNPNSAVGNSRIEEKLELSIADIKYAQ